jgi:hypothetical protein
MKRDRSEALRSLCLAVSCRVLPCLAVHPFLSGVPHDSVGFGALCAVCFVCVVWLSGLCCSRRSSGGSRSSLCPMSSTGCISSSRNTPPSRIQSAVPFALHGFVAIHCDRLVFVVSVGIVCSGFHRCRRVASFCFLCTSSDSARCMPCPRRLPLWRFGPFPFRAIVSVASRCESLGRSLQCQPRTCVALSLSFISSALTALGAAV